MRILETLTLVSLLHFCSIFADICEPPVKQNGLIPPRFPLSYFAEFETHFGNQSKTVESTVYVDMSNRIAAKQQRIGDTTTRNIWRFDDNTQFTIIWKGLASVSESLGYKYKCTASSLVKSDIKKFQDFYKKQTLFHDGPFAFEEKNVNDSIFRGVNANFFKGCVTLKEFEKEFKFKVEYIFSTSNEITSSGISRIPLGFIATSDNKLLSKSQFLDQKIYTNYYYFDEMKPEYQKFLQIPDGTYCDGYTKSKVFPTIDLDYLVTGVEILISTFEMVMGASTKTNEIAYHKIFISKSQDMRRIDFVADQNFMNGEYSGKEISIIHNTKTDASFIIDKKTGKCHFYESEVLSKEESGLMTLNFMELFFFKDINSNDYQYKGTEKCGEFECEVWVLNKGIVDSDTGGKPIPFWIEVKFLTSHYTEAKFEDYNSRIPYTVTSYYNESTSTASTTYSMSKFQLTFFDYQKEEPDLMDFNLDTCLYNDEKLFLIFYFNIHSDEFHLIDEHRRSIKDGFKKLLTEKGKVPTTRIQDLEVVINTDASKSGLIFSITPAYRTDFEDISQRSAIMVKNSLQWAIDSNKLELTLNIVNGELRFGALQGSLRSIFDKPSSSSPLDNFEVLNDIKISDEIQDKNYKINDPFEFIQENNVPRVFGQTTTQKASLKAPNSQADKNNYGTGPLVASIVVLLFVGFAVGSFITLLYMRKFYYNNDSGFEESKSFALDDISN